jgi:hypothetical protein
VLALLRDDPTVPVGYTFGFGFGRIDLTDYYGGPHALPTATFEAGPRFKTSEVTFVDVLARGQWATASAPPASSTSGGVRRSSWPWGPTPADVRLW